ncbi:MAG: transcription antitermination factor NusB [Candidatus Latescibacteria bacterium]|nr:transcription antitermination factor NusB [Candidatus Latescibacterota bacterium]
MLQALYEAEFSERSTHDIIEEQIGRRSPSDETAQYARALFLKTMEKKGDLDGVIQSLLENWDPSRVSLVDRNILRFALAEVLYFPDVPGRVIIDEAIEVAHRFSSEEAGRFVNGLVDRFVKEFRKDGA